MTAKHRTATRTPEADLRWEVHCTDCPPSYLSRAATEPTAAMAAAAHEALCPGHVTTYRPVNPQEETPHAHV